MPTTPGESVTAEYTGSAPPFVQASSECLGPESDAHELVLEGDGAVTLAFNIAWDGGERPHPHRGRPGGHRDQRRRRLPVGDGDAHRRGAGDLHRLRLLLHRRRPAGLRRHDHGDRGRAAAAGRSDRRPRARVRREPGHRPAALAGRVGGLRGRLRRALQLRHQRRLATAPTTARCPSTAARPGARSAPRPSGETGTAQGGGDCAIGTGQQLNEEGNRQLAFIGLGPLTGFSTFTSPDNGRTMQRSPDQNGLAKFNQTSLVDRQWLVFTDAQTVFLNYNAALVSARRRGPGHPEVRGRRPDLRPAVLRGHRRQPPRPDPGDPRGRRPRRRPVQGRRLLPVQQRQPRQAGDEPGRRRDLLPVPRGRRGRGPDGGLRRRRPRRGRQHLRHVLREGRRQRRLPRGARGRQGEGLQGPEPGRAVGGQQRRPRLHRQDPHQPRGRRDDGHAVGRRRWRSRPRGGRVLRHAEHRQPRQRRVQGDLARLREPAARPVRRRPRRSSRPRPRRTRATTTRSA